MSKSKNIKAIWIRILTLIEIVLLIVSIVGFNNMTGLDAIGFSLLLWVPIIIIGLVDLAIISVHIYDVVKLKKQIDVIALILVAIFIALLFSVPSLVKP